MTGFAASRTVLAFLGLFSGAPALAAPRTVERTAFQLTFDDAVWVEQPAPPPALLALSSIAAGCEKDTLLSFVVDPRPLMRPGASAFGPGAVSAAMVDLLAQRLTPGGRLIARSPAEPAVVDNVPGYRASYVIEDRSLARIELVTLLTPVGDATLHVRLTSAHLHAACEQRLMAVLSTLHVARRAAVTQDTAPRRPDELHKPP